MESYFPQDDEVDADFFDTPWTNDLFANLENITLKNTPCLSNDMHFIEFVLSRARLLHKFFVYRDDTSSLSKPSEEAVFELAKYRRVSPKAKVFFRNMDVSTLNLQNYLHLLKFIALSYNIQSCVIYSYEFLCIIIAPILYDKSTENAGFFCCF